jgi:phospholipase C
MKRHVVISGCLAAAFAFAAAGAIADERDRDDLPHIFTATPIKHLVVIFQENVSFDHYFGTYPFAQNNPGETPFHASHHTPKSINTLLTPLDTTHNFAPLVGIDLINHNPNSNSAVPTLAPNNKKTNGAGAANPFRLSPSQALTADQGHNDQPEQSAYDNGLMDGFPAWVSTAGPPPLAPPAVVTTKGLVMGYYDGNTATALWNYAQFYAMNDNAYTTQFGPSSPGAINLIAGQTSGFATAVGVVSGSTLLHPTHETFADASNSPSKLTMVGDADPLGDVCSTFPDQVTMAGNNVGDLLNAQGVTWGWFEGGFDLTIVNPGPPTSTGCLRKTVPAAPGTPAFTSLDYIPHHQPFQYYASTANPTHARPSSVAAIGHSNIPGTHNPDPANHQYDSHDFFDALEAGNLPAVSFLKAPAFQDGHAGYSDPLDEQTFIVQVINALQQSPEWRETAVIVTYDDSDGWYDHQMPPIVNPSFSPTVFNAILNVPTDTLNGPAKCNAGFQQGTPTPATPLNGAFNTPAWGRCGYGTRLPFLVVSPFAKRNFVDHSLIDQASVLRFIEDNWLSGQRIQPGGSMDTIAGKLDHMFDFDGRDRDEPRKLILDPATGAVVISSFDDDDDHDRH